MIKRLKSLKLWPLYLAVSAVVILAGIILYALMGFNTAMDKAEYKTFEVRYNVVAVINNKEEEVQKVCEDAFQANGLSYSAKNVYSDVAGSTNLETGGKRLVYEFAASTADTALAAAKTTAESKLAFKGADGEDLAVEMNVTVNTVKGQSFYEASWRAAVAIAVGAVVVLVYLGVRFGVASALSGLVGMVNATFFTLGVFAVFRIPVYSAAPLLYAAIAAIAFTLLWLLHCMKMRDNFKDPDFGKYDAASAVASSLLTSDKTVYWTAGAFALAIALVGAVTASTAMMALVLPALVAVCAGLYSAALFAPSVHVPCKCAIDKFKSRKTPTYQGKKNAKAAKPDAED